MIALSGGKLGPVHTAEMSKLSDNRSFGLVYEGNSGKEMALST